MLRLCYKVLLCVVCCIPLLAQTQAAAATVEKEDTLHLPFFKRFSISTNAVDWVFATPNLGVEWDFSGSTESRFSILLNGKYNWNTHHSINPRISFMVGDHEKDMEFGRRLGFRCIQVSESFTFSDAVDEILRSP